jgi:ParB family chromosome partitioning protein
MSKRNRLGRGLSALFEEAGETSGSKENDSQKSIPDAESVETGKNSGTSEKKNPDGSGVQMTENQASLKGENMPENQEEQPSESTEPEDTIKNLTKYISAGDQLGSSSEDRSAEEQTGSSSEDRSAEDQLASSSEDRSSKNSVENAPVKTELTASENRKGLIEKRTRTKKNVSGDGRIYVSIALIDASGDQPRQEFDAEELAQLAESIKNYGILQPLLVAKKDERYEIIAGERRFRAAKMVGLQKIPVIIGDYSKQESMEVQLIENIQRSDLNPIEEARAYQKLIQEFGLKQEELAKRVSKNRVTISNSMRLLRLDEQVQTMLAAGNLSAGHARALLAVKDKDKQRELAEKIVSNDLSVRQVEKIVKKMAEEEENPKEEMKDPEEERIAIFYQDLADHLKQVMGTKVQIRRKDENRGKIEIEYYSPEELERITDLLQSVRSNSEQ